MAEASVVNDPVLEGKLDSIDIVNQGEYIPGNLGTKDELLPGNDKQPRRFRRKQVRRIEVPTIRKVKVPVVTKEIVPCEIERRVVVKKAVEVVDYEEVQEQYTEYEDRKGTRQREIWKESVDYKEEVRERPVQKTRKVKRPITRIVEEPDEQIVKVQSTKIEEVQAWRIDEVTEWREVEEASYEVYDLIHETVGSQVVGTRDLGSIDSQHVNRTKGTSIYSEEHIRAGQVDLKDIEEDKHPDNHTQAQQALYSSQSFSSADRIGDDGQKLLGDGGMGAQKRITGPAPSQAAPAPARSKGGRRKGGRGAAAEEPDSY